MKQAILAARGERVVLLFPFLLFEELFCGEYIDAFTGVCNFESPFDIVFVEAELVYHSVDGAVD
jgi:hypothetical protein